MTPEDIATIERALANRRDIEAHVAAQWRPIRDEALESRDAAWALLTDTQRMVNRLIECLPESSPLVAEARRLLQRGIAP